ncbi:hypothetical protein [Planococcus donghaensis]|uniref:hypothetical protein n=1 Tax=Planococcus donghaensis TaxID=414778 RepID=UPI003736E212
MSKNPSADHKEVRFYFSRSKGSHVEAGECFVTLLARLSIEVFYAGKPGDKGEYKTVWVDIEELKVDQAASKIKKMPDSINRYEISEELFWDLFKVSQRCPEELYCLTPLSHLNDYSSNR